ncbi:hypothetical protein SARC_00826 [Sphaeroforma arctica JP610]|uniref:Uncharacterized protein n=1 Tax=Sphaeroforma arctica JP610 TaxID=667725 RepID=A0A0L0GDK9_9EUKA|nr:hypothetical protein SARC_00826 [Sphaeroforma arctica JP610]KNC87082.1 hypothetical protein SARC_00826 [Sphaeroforma arctica JP610]|eukprot:XP_014160984.1 hypothetical protein SARC_00826 [Sphaeroforma arctica JP610]
MYPYQQQQPPGPPGQPGQPGQPGAAGFNPQHSVGSMGTPQRPNAVQQGQGGGFQAPSAQSGMPPSQQQQPQNPMAVPHHPTGPSAHLQAATQHVGGFQSQPTSASGLNPNFSSQQQPQQQIQQNNAFQSAIHTPQAPSTTQPPPGGNPGNGGGLGSPSGPPSANMPHAASNPAVNRLPPTSSPAAPPTVSSPGSHMQKSASTHSMGSLSAQYTHLRPKQSDRGWNDPPTALFGATTASAANSKETKNKRRNMRPSAASQHAQMYGDTAQQGYAQPQGNNSPQAGQFQQPSMMQSPNSGNLTMGMPPGSNNQYGGYQAQQPQNASIMQPGQAGGQQSFGSPLPGQPPLQPQGFPLQTQAQAQQSPQGYGQQPQQQGYAPQQPQQGFVPHGKQSQQQFPQQGGFQPPHLQQQQAMGQPPPGGAQPGAPYR